MAESYLGRLQSMFSDPYAASGGRAVTGGMSPMQERWAQGPSAMVGGNPVNTTPRPGMVEAGRIAPGRGWPSPQNFTTVGDPRQVGGPLRPAAPYTPNFTMPGPSYGVPATVPGGAMVSAGSPVSQAARFGGMVQDVTPRLPAPSVQPANTGIVARMLGIAAPALRAAAPVMRTVGNPYLQAAGMGALTLAALADGQAEQEQMPIGGQGTMPTGDPLVDQIPGNAPMMQPSLVSQIPTPMSPAPMAAPAQAPRAPARAPMRAQAPMSMPMSTVREGQNANIGDDARQRAMAWLALQQGAQ